MVSAWFRSRLTCWRSAVRWRPLAPAISAKGSPSCRRTSAILPAIRAKMLGASKIRSVPFRIRSRRCGEDLEQIIAAAEAENQKNALVLSNLTVVQKDMDELAAGSEEILAGADAILLSLKEGARGAQQVAAAAEEAGSAAAEASAAAKQQARGAEELAAAIEEIASLAEDIQSRNG